MRLSIELPDDLADQLGTRWKDLPRRTLEALIADACREKLIRDAQAQQILGLDSRLELEAFLKRADVHLEYSEADLEADIAAMDTLLGA